MERKKEEVCGGDAHLVCRFVTRKIVSTSQPIRVTTDWRVEVYLAPYTEFALHIKICLYSTTSVRG